MPCPTRDHADLRSVISLRAELFAIFEAGYRIEKEVYAYFEKHGRSTSTAKIEEFLRVGLQTGTYLQQSFPQPAFLRTKYAASGVPFLSDTSHSSSLTRERKC